MASLAYNLKREICTFLFCKIEKLHNVNYVAQRLFEGRSTVLIDLFRHNQDAYNAALQMLCETGKAAIIHPTGTGKSFIAFKLCEDFSEKKICWLSPSEYIFQTQLENLREASGGYTTDNIRFFTYAKLMNLSGEEIAAVAPDYVVLDEFHRCGAQMWGKGVQTLLNRFPDVPVMGLSATAIRYLDNQRDMADELFDGNVASEMTLGEAIVRGILNPPQVCLVSILLSERTGKIRSSHPTTEKQGGTGKRRSAFGGAAPCAGQGRWTGRAFLQAHGRS